MSKKPTRAKRKEMHARSAKTRTASAPQNPAPTVVEATPSSPSKAESAPIAPKEAARRRPKRSGSKAAVKAAEAKTQDEQRVSDPPAAPAKKKPSREHVFLAFAALIGVAVLVAYFATRKPSAPPLQEDKPTTEAPQKAAEKPTEAPTKPVDLPAPTPVVIAPPPTVAAPAPTPIDSAVPTDKPAPVAEPSAKKPNDPHVKNDPPPKATTAPPPAPTQPIKIAPKKPVPTKSDDYE